MASALRMILRILPPAQASASYGPVLADRGDGPPDLDELWQDVNRRINKLFGSKRSGPLFGGSDNGGAARGAGIGVGLVLLIAVMLWLGSGMFIVNEGQVGVILQFGKYKETTRAGFQWRLPYPIQTHEIVNLSRVQTVEIGYQDSVKSKVPKESLMLTHDENIIDIQFAVQYRLKDPVMYLFKNRDVETTVKQAAETSIREMVGKSNMDEVLYEKRDQIANDVSELMQKILDRYETGVILTNVTLQSVQAPDQVQSAFDDAIKAGQDSARAINEGQTYANEVIPRAIGTASRLSQEAAGYRQKVIAQAEGDASRFKQILSAYNSAPAVTRQRMYLEAMQEIFSNTTKVMVDAKTGNNLLYLPLDKLIREASVADAAKAAAAAVPAPAQIPGSQIATAPPVISSDADSRSRDSLRSREREDR